MEYVDGDDGEPDVERVIEAIDAELRALEGEQRGVEARYEHEQQRIQARRSALERARSLLHDEAATETGPEPGSAGALPGEPAGARRRGASTDDAHVGNLYPPGRHVRRSGE